MFTPPTSYFKKTPIFMFILLINSTVVLAYMYIEVIRFSVKLLLKVDLAFFNQNLVV